MIVEVKIPSPGESITEAEIGRWLVEDGEYVQKDQELAEVESDKATLSLMAPESGTIKIIIQIGITVKIGQTACRIDTSAKNKNNVAGKKENTNAQITSELSNTFGEQNIEKQKKEIFDRPATSASEHIKITPVAQKMMEDNNLSIDDILSGLKKISRKEVESVISLKHHDNQSTKSGFTTGTREVNRTSISQLRKKLSSRLVAVKNETAMLTTFNEVDLSRVIALRKKYQDQFLQKHSVKLGFMSFFAYAVTSALKDAPKINSMIDGDEIITPSYVDIGIAVQTEKGLIVPVIRNTEKVSLPELELNIADLAERSRIGKISLAELSGGTFTITNGGVYGSMLSTPILNPPQSAILGMHKIMERPVAISGKVEIRPMMYLALSYDHRIVDGKDSVSFLVKIKELLESPEELLFGNSNLDSVFLGERK